MIDKLRNLEDVDWSFINKTNSKESYDKIKQETGFNLETWNDIVGLQNSLNLKVDKNWKNNKLDWKTAMIIESSELVDSIDWKWWKNGNTDWDNLEIEAIDLFHFLLAKAIEGDLQNALSAVSIAKDLAERDTPVDDKNERLAQKIKNIIINEFLQFLLVDNVVGAYMVWLKIWYLMGNDINDLFKIYKMKYCLNIFRQDHGYKTGEYKKLWNGLEDNVYAQKLIVDIPLDKDFVDNLYKELEKIYSTLSNPKEKTLKDFINQEEKWKEFMIQVPEGTRKIMFDLVKDYEIYLEK